MRIAIKRKATGRQLCNQLPTELSERYVKVKKYKRKQTKAQHQFEQSFCSIDFEIQLIEGD